MKRSPHILVTRNLSKKEIEFASNLGIRCTIEPFIRFHPKKITPVIKDILADPQNKYWIFSSSNAILPILPILNDLSDKNNKKIFCIGTKTASYFRHQHIQIILPPQANATSLINTVLNDYTSGKIVFFRGNLSRTEIPLGLQKRNIPFTELEIYETQMEDKKIDINHFDGITFFSPSAVQSFLKNIQIPLTLPLFAIGTTTGNFIKQKLNNKVIIAEQSTSNKLFEKIKQYFFVY